MKKMTSNLFYTAAAVLLAGIFTSCASGYNRSQSAEEMNGPVDCVDFHSKRMQWHYVERGIHFAVDGSCNRGMRHGQFRYFADGKVAATVKFSKDNEVKTSCSVPGADARAPLNACLSQLSQTSNASTENGISPWMVSPDANAQESAAQETAPAAEPMTAEESAVQETAPASVSNTDWDKPAQPQPEAKKEDPNVDRHSGFYLDGTVAFQYDNYSYEYDRYNLDRDFSGMGVGFELRAGVNFRNLVAPFGFLGYSLVFGDEDLVIDRNSGETGTITNTRGRRFSLGAGAAIYPFRNRNSAMYGFFIAPEFGISIFWLRDSEGHSDNYNIHAAEYPDSDVSDFYDSYAFEWDYAPDDFGVHFQLELGKLWAISDSWNVGFGVAAAIDGENTEENQNECDYSFCSDEFFSYSFRAGIKIVHK